MGCCINVKGRNCQGLCSWERRRMDGEVVRKEGGHAKEEYGRMLEAERNPSASMSLSLGICRISDSESLCDFPGPDSPSDVPDAGPRKCLATAHQLEEETMKVHRLKIAVVAEPALTLLKFDKPSRVYIWMHQMEQSAAWTSSSLLCQREGDDGGRALSASLEASLDSFVCAYTY
ncbi:hypothetical protein ACLOJK_008059 [Asimina triloba]